MAAPTLSSKDSTSVLWRSIGISDAVDEPLRLLL
jgi:hypothetical protein